MKLPEKPTQQSAASDGHFGAISVRLWEATKNLITISDHLKILEKEDSRLQGQVEELGRNVLELVKEVHDLAGQMKGIEKRFDDKDKMIEAIIRVKIAEEIKELEVRLASHTNTK